MADTNPTLAPLPVSAKWQADARKSAMRAAIERQADQLTREGVIADVLGVVVVGLARLTVALANAKTLADVNVAAQPLADIGAAVNAAILSGALKLPYMVKPGGALGALADMTRVSSGVAEILAAQMPVAQAAPAVQPSVTGQVGPK